MRRLAVVAVVLLGLVTSCADDSDPPGDAPGASASDAPLEVYEAGDPPPGISVRLVQLRQGYGSRELQLQVVNNSDRLMRVERATYRSPSFVEPAVWDDGTRIPGGFTIDLPVILPESRCTPDDNVEESVTLDFRQGDSGLLHKSYAPEELYDSVTNLIEEDCARRAVARIADVRLADDIEIDGEGRDSVARLAIIIEPTGRPGSFGLESIAATTLLSPNSGGDSWDLGIEVDGESRPLRPVLAIRPTRCDPHAMADNSQGTEVTATFSLGEQTTTVVLGTSNDLEGRLSEFVAAHCGYGG
ncbi:MAG: hypothetical protein ACRDO7_12745 [Nocardioidaceae bacterium]